MRCKLSKLIKSYRHIHFSTFDSKNTSFGFTIKKKSLSQSLYVNKTYIKIISYYTNAGDGTRIHQ